MPNFGHVKSLLRFLSIFFGRGGSEQPLDVLYPDAFSYLPPL
jgi:hypothetical protein